MKTDTCNEHDIEDVEPEEWREVVEQLLAYAKRKGLSSRRMKLGWSIDVNRKPTIHIEVFARKVGVVPQLRYMERWNEQSVLRELRRLLEHLFDRANLQFPTIGLTKLHNNPEAFVQLCRAFDWFLEQISKRRIPSHLG